MVAGILNKNILGGLNKIASVICLAACLEHSRCSKYGDPYFTEKQIMVWENW